MSTAAFSPGAIRSFSSNSECRNTVDSTVMTYPSYKLSWKLSQLLVPLILFDISNNISSVNRCDSNMELTTSQEATEVWRITRRRAHVLCVQNRMTGATNKSDPWLIPRSSQRPTERRYSKNNVRATVGK